MEDNFTPGIPRLNERYPLGPFCLGVLDTLAHEDDYSLTARRAAQAHLEACFGCRLRNAGSRRLN